MKFAQTAALAATTLTAGTLARVQQRQSSGLEPVTTRGNAFYRGDERFYIRGVAYQPGGAADAQDPLLDLDTLRNDVQLFERLGINTIRIYTIDNSANHDEAMSMLADAGIYLALDANTPDFSLNRENAASLHASYNDVYLQSVFATIDTFAGYDNLLASPTQQENNTAVLTDVLQLFFSGNEVINAKNNTNAAPYIKAVTRDMKRYIGAHANRAIPVGYSAADVAENIEPQAKYFACGEDDNARSDFFAFNDYSWCDPSSFEEAGWDAKVETYSDYPLPIFLSEFGCITNTREWNEIAAIYSDKMTSVYSGGLAYEFTVEPNGYGLVEVANNGSAVPNADFRRLEEAFAETPAPSGNGGARTDTEWPECPPEDDQWAVTTNKLPAIPEGAEEYITGSDGAGEGPGLDTEEGSQWAGTPSETEPDLSNGVTTSEDTSNSSGGSSNTGSGSGSGGSSGSSESDSGAEDAAEGKASGLQVGFGTVVALAAVLAFAAQ